VSADDKRGVVPDVDAMAGGAAPGREAAAPLGVRLAIWARLLAADVTVGLLWALLLAAAVLFISGVSQFIYVAF
jgi:hypothetical protein